MHSLLRRIFPLSAIFFTLLFAVCTADAQAVSRFDLPAQPLVDSLKALASQTSVNVFFEPKLVAGRQAPALKAQLSMEEALRRLLAGTGLTYQQVDEKTVTIVQASVIQESSSAAQPVFAAGSGEKLRVAQPGTENMQKVSDAAAHAQDPSANEQSDGQAQEVLVTGSRIRSLVGDQGMQPLITITSRDIERYGISSLGDVFRYLPQVSGLELGQMVHSSSLGQNSPAADVGSTRISATIRGAPAGGTLLLINGRRAPKNGQGSIAVGGGGAYDISGIPLSAIDRIEVLLDGASAIYGADAVGGVINVILKRDYRGTEARLGQENTFDTDAAVRTASIAHGFSSERWSTMLTGSWEDANALMWRDRDFLRTFDRRAFGGNDLRSASSIGGAGRIRVASGTLPGLSSNQAAIPVGSSGTNLTVQNYANAGAVSPALDLGQYAQYSTPYNRRSLVAQTDYTFSAAAVAFFEGHWGRSSTWSSSNPLSASGITLPAGAPGNPFGVAVLLDKFFLDQPLPVRRATTENRGLTLGLRGQLLRDWRYEVAANQTRTDGDLEADSNSVLNAARVNAAFAAGTNPVLAYDSSAGISPNAAGVLSALTLLPAGREVGENRTFSVAADGALFKTWAGELRVAVGAEYREEAVDFPIPSTNLNRTSFSRYTSAHYAELRLPLLSAQQKIRFLNRLDLSVAGREDRYSDFPSASTGRISLMAQPVKGLILRGSYGEGYKVPTLNQLYRPDTQGLTFPSSSVVDALRGNTPVPSSLLFILKGNPGLSPERSESRSAGAVFDVPWMSGLSFSVDYFDTRYIERVGSIVLTDRIVLFPATVRRGPNLATDPAGWAGPVTGYDDIPINIGSERIAGYEFATRYNRLLGSGELLLTAAASHVTLREVRSKPNLPPTIQSTPDAIPLKGNASVFWSRDGLDIGMLCSYRDKLRGTTTATVFVPSAIRWDLSLGYDFSRRSSPILDTGWGRRLFGGTRLNLAIFNVLNRDPPLVPGNFLPDNTILDSRLRRYSLALTRQF